MGGDGLALPAGTCSLTKPTIFFAMLALPAEHSFMQLGGSNIVLSAIKRSEDGTAVVVRFWNSGANESVANLILDRKPKSVYLSNIKEDRLEQLPAANPIEISVPSKRIVTLLI